MVGERSRSDRTRKTTAREEMIIARVARRNRFATTASIRDELNFEAHISVGTVKRRLNEQPLCTRRPIKWSQLS